MTVQVVMAIGQYIVTPICIAAAAIAYIYFVLRS